MLQSRPKFTREKRNEPQPKNNHNPAHAHPVFERLRPRAKSVPPTVTPSPVPMATDTHAPTSTPVPPMLMVGGDIPCYAGPGPDYETVATISIVITVEVLSKDSKGDFWIVKTPDGNNQCWIESKYSTIIGQANTIPALAAEAVPTRTMILPVTPNNLTAAVSCNPIREYNGGWPRATDKKTVFIKLHWINIEKETGVRLFKNGALLTEIQANISDYTDEFVLEKGSPVKVLYTLEAFNEFGASPTIEVAVFVNFQTCK